MGYYSWDDLSQICNTCQSCVLAEHRTQAIVGAGVPTAEVLFVGTAPSALEDSQGQPFVGPSGQLLDEMLALIDLSRHHNIYLTNLVKCHPPGARDPLYTEQEACLPHLRNQFRLLAPKIVVCLGQEVAQQLIHPNFQLSTDHGKFVEKKGCLLTATHHPSTLLHSPAQRPVCYQDLKLLQEKIHAVCQHTYQPPNPEITSDLF